MKLANTGCLALACLALACSTNPGLDPSDAGGPDAGDAGFSDGGDAGSIDGGLCDVNPTGLVSLPADDGQHDDAGIEWWYWTGHLETADGGWFGFEEVFFREIALGTVG
jgi:hypothetical protein